MPVKNPRSRFSDINLSERGSTRQGSDYAMPGTADMADPTTGLHTVYHGCKVRKDANQTITDADNQTVIPWQKDVWDTDNIHNLALLGASMNTRFFVPQGLGGFWSASIWIASDADTAATTRCDVLLEKNTAGTHDAAKVIQTFRLQGDNNTGGWDGGARDVVRLEVGDYVEWFFDSLDETRVLQSGTARACFAIFEFMGPVANAEVE